MGRYVTPAGVVIEMSDKAALTIGYKAAAPADADEKPTPKPRAKRAAAKK